MSRFLDKFGPASQPTATPSPLDDFIQPDLDNFGGPAPPNSNGFNGGHGQQGALTGPLEGFERRPEWNMLPHGPISSAALRQYAQILENRYNISSRTKAALDEFAALNTMEERLMLAIVLLSDGQEKAKQDTWVMTSELKLEIKHYTRVFLLSPRLGAYRGVDIDAHILDVMRESRVKGLPERKEIAQTKTVLEEINTVLTNFRNHMKTKIKDSLSPTSSIRNIGDLTAAILSPTQVKATIQVYLRIAFLRLCMADSTTTTNDQFWVSVDEELHSVRSDMSSEVELSQFFTNVFEADKRKYGDPAATRHQVIEARNVESWIEAVNRKASKVEAKLHRKGNKRPRTGTADGDDDEDSNSGEIASQ
ncbi:hypothetical protein DFP72DRAFT_839564 [Ephemerocybe angulata]|uniref:Uncharacterized protein n=1 Tax=Ephemerocybe angulata TaxID=980116 RepID=A0A8H6IK18_9AGAR|nr:hypothetical protein DFP72DRAFT_839564 [Tulosesus angulatus]